MMQLDAAKTGVWEKIMRVFRQEAVGTRRIKVRLYLQNEMKKTKGIHFQLYIKTVPSAIAKKGSAKNQFWHK